MSKRKRSVPVRLNWSVLSEEGSPVAKRVSFNLPETDDSYKLKRKKLLKSPSPNSVVFGEISFSINTPEEIKFDCDEVEFSILAQKLEDLYELQLRICLLADKSTCAVFQLSTENDALSNCIGDLLHNHYVWVVEKINEIHTGTLCVNITTTPEKMPILKARNLVNLFFGQVEQYSNGSTRKKACTETFYKELKSYQRYEALDVEVQHDKLVPKLRPYQVKAVQWMLQRESEELECQNTEWLSSVVVLFKSKCNKNLYYNKYSGMLAVEFCDFPDYPRGGILADEMGLGKTVSIISLILSHVRNVSEETDNADFLLTDSKTNGNLVFERNKSFRTDEETVKQNKEDCLSPHEKLLHSKASKGPALREALNEWYKSKLAEYSSSSCKKERRKSDNRMKCICGSVPLKSSELCVRCPECQLFQHVDCVGFQKNFLYFCPPCWKKQKLVKSNATLIIAPASIYHQWFDEIKKHVVPDGFSRGVYMYDGLKRGFVQPSFLSSHDVVITTYAILRAEVNHAIQNDSDRKLRNEERFLKLCSPLRQIQWWRLCLDEAQMVENDYSSLNQMVNLISSVNRWSVTGTPIQKSLQDLYFLVEWLGVMPFAAKPVWDDLLYLPYMHGNKTPLCSVVSKVFWRNSKEDVAEELMIPNQTVKYHFLKFSAIEQNFYMREHAVSSAEFSENLRKSKLDVNQTIDSLEKNTLTRLLAPMLNLRQACLHPLAVKGNKISGKTKGMTLTELLQYLSNKTKVECEEGMRKYVAALNGLAGIRCIEENWIEAVELYRQVLRFAEEYKDKVQVDSLQRIHTLTNLAEILRHHPEGIPPTLRDDFLLDDAKALEEKYMQKTSEEHEAEENQLKELSSKVSDLEGKFESATDVWWARLIHTLTIHGLVEELIDKITAELITSEVGNRKNIDLFLRKISTIKGIEITLHNWLKSIQDNRKKTLSHVEKLRESSCEDLVYDAVDCHLRPLNTETKKKCQLCACESVLLDYECALFDVSRKVLKEAYEKVLDGAQTKGSWRAQNAEKCLKVLLSLAKSKNVCEEWCLQDGKNHVRMLEAMKKEFKQLRAVWMSINHRVQACDEISMCKLRLRLRLPGEPLPPKMTNLSLVERDRVETIYIIDRHEVEAQKLKLSGELELSKSEFKKKYGTLLYLGNLGKKENPKPDPCPVCNTVLDNEWCVLQCGHSYCIDCVRILLDRSLKQRSIGCPVCREHTKSSDLSFVDLSGKEEDSDTNVVGEHSTKVDGIVRSLLELKKNEPNVKVLVFSTWKVVLKIIEVAFGQNGISFRRMPGHDYQRHLKEFRDPGSKVTALLLPISWGSKGLNLTEASHVFLVEPVTNPAEELQAIGRVHRIGQTKETVVHRFLIRRTIEEKIHGAVSEAKDKWGQKKVTLEDLKNLFDMKNDLVTSDPCH